MFSNTNSMVPVAAVLPVPKGHPSLLRPLSQRATLTSHLLDSTFSTVTRTVWTRPSVLPAPLPETESLAATLGAGAVVGGTLVEEAAPCFEGGAGGDEPAGAPPAKAATGHRLIRAIVAANLIHDLLAATGPFQGTGPIAFKTAAVG